MLEYRKRINDVVQRRLHEQGVKKCFLAEKCGYKPNEFSAILSGGKKNLTADDIIKLCTGLEIEPNQILPMAVDSSAPRRTIIYSGEGVRS